MPHPYPPEKESSMNETVAKLKPKSGWSNKDNKAIYEWMPLAHFKALAEKIGFAQGEDIENIRPYVKNACSILDVGGGYGRVIKKVFEINPDATIATVERNHRLSNYLRKQFPQLTVYEEDFLQVKLNKKFDLILLMWSEITEYNKQEQLRLILNMRNLLTKSGKIVIELACLIDGKHPYASCTDAQNFEYEYAHGKDNFYVPTAKDLQDLYAAAGLGVERIIDYSPNGFLRNINILRAL